MSQRLRTPALAPPPIRPAVARPADPTGELEGHYRMVWESRMRGLPFVNPALDVAVVGFTRHQGDWLGVVVTPWFLNLFLISGGGSLWGDIPAGERRYIELPCGALQFIADDDPELGPTQYCPLIAPVSNLPDQATALQAARDAMQAIFTAPPVPGEEAAINASAASAGDTSPPPARRAFFRRLAGKK